MSFETDLDDGQEFEREFIQWLYDHGYKDIEQPSGLFSDYDIKGFSMQKDKYFTFELKSDRKAKDTGNVAVEVGKVINGADEPSGLSISKADFFIYKVVDEVFCIKVPLLRTMSYTGRVLLGGDNDSARLSLITLDRFKSRAIKIY